MTSFIPLKCSRLDVSGQTAHHQPAIQSKQAADGDPGATMVFKSILPPRLEGVSDLESVLCDGRSLLVAH